MAGVSGHHLPRAAPVRARRRVRRRTRRRALLLGAAPGAL